MKLILILTPNINITFHNILFKVQLADPLIISYNNLHIITLLLKMSSKIYSSFSRKVEIHIKIKKLKF